MKKTYLFLCLTLMLPVIGFSQADYPVGTEFMPLTFDGKFNFSLETPLPIINYQLSIINYQLLDSTGHCSLAIGNCSDFYPHSDVFGGKNEYVRQLRKNTQHAALWRDNLPVARYVSSDFAGEAEKEVPLKPEPLHDVFTVKHKLNASLDGAAIFVPKRQYWFKNGRSFLQFSNNRLSQNWYNGGTDNLNMQSVQSYTINYKSDKVQFNSFIEWKLSLYTNPKDTVRGTRFGEDLVRYYGDFGLKANAHWSYSTNLEIKTRLFRSYKENSDDVIGAFFSPLNVNMGVLGMKYQFEKQSKADKHKKTTVSADISPLAVQYAYVEDKSVDPTRYGVKEGFHDLLEYGSSLNAKTVIQFNYQISFSSRLKYFTDYEHVLVESENELNLAISQFLSTRLYLYARFDDTEGITRDRDLHYWQLNEVLSFGFNYKF